MKKGRIVFWCGVFLVILLNGAAWNSTAFADWYIANIFPIWVGTYGRLTGLFPFSVGEWLIAAGLVLTAAAGVLGVLWAVWGLAFLVCRVWKAWGPGTRMSGTWMQKTGGCFGRFTRGFYRFFAWTLLAVSLVMTLNCFILYHASTFSEHYFGEQDAEYSLVDLIAVYNMVASECNRLALEMERDERGMVVYPGSTGAQGESLDMADKARELMARLGETYPQLRGYYPRPKAMFFSDFMCQQHMQGYYFPFSMEANYNDVMHILNIPSTMCHELAHLRGYIYEDEANFIGYLACVE